MTLADVKSGRSVVVRRIHDATVAVQRLMTLGLVEGAEVAMVRRSLGGDPLEIRLYGSSISLRREQAQCIEVEAW